jgi:murein DD-endopeptidase MepM/ murein hydrolase activator NlpD
VSRARDRAARRRGLGLATGAAAALLGVASPAEATRFRRPTAEWAGVSAHYDNNRASGATQDYNCGRRTYDQHNGTDFPVRLGTTVLAVADGRVVATHNGCPNYGGLGNTCGGRCGNYVSIQHADGNRSIYCHMQLDSIMVSVGQTVRCGQAIGRTASSGSSTGPHLHLAWRRSSGDTDSYRGNCSTSPGVWVDQNGYGEPPGAECECPANDASCARADAGAPARDAGLPDRAADRGPRPAPDGGPPDSAPARDAGPPAPDAPPAAVDAEAPAPATPVRGAEEDAAGGGPILDDVPGSDGCGCRVAGPSGGGAGLPALALGLGVAARAARWIGRRRGPRRPAHRRASLV